jgi:uncharacterized OsmC-like protein
MSTLNFAIKGVSLNATKFESKARSFSFIVDEPPALGGNDEGPNPVEYLLGSYAGCLNVVINLIAKERNININRLEITIDGDLDPAKFIGTTGFNRAGFQSINVLIDLQTNADEVTNYELIKAAKERCPINDNLTNPTQINYTLASKAASN